jgi:LPXTG-site transpeptidase (sortase) family protein
MDMPGTPRRTQSPLRRTQLLLMAVAGLALNTWFIGILGGEVLQFLAARSLAREFAAAAASRGGAISGRGAFPDGGVMQRDPTVHDGTVREGTSVRGAATGTACIGRIEIPRIRLSSLIVEGTGSLSLLSGAGHLSNSALPGDPGNVVLAAHRDTHFRELRDIRAGDLVRIETPYRTVFYCVDSTVVVDPTRTDLLAPTDESRLTLITCYPFRWIGRAPKRFVVTAHAVPPLIATPAADGRPL